MAKTEEGKTQERIVKYLRKRGWWVEVRTVTMYEAVGKPDLSACISLSRY